MAPAAKYLVLFMLFLVRLGDLRGQDPPGEKTFRIEYLDQYTLEANASRFRLSELVLGRTENSLIRPVDVSAVGLDTFWVADQGRGTIFLYSGGNLEEFPLRRLKLDPFPSLVATCSLPEGKLAFSDSKLDRICIFDRGQKEMTLLNDTLRLEKPTGIAYSADRDEFWISETGKHRLLVMDSGGRLLRTVGARGSGPGEFNFPTHICLDREGNVLVVDAMNYRIQVFDPEGNFLSMFGKQGDASGYFARPKGIASDSYGHIYVADALFHVVQVFARDGSYLHAFGAQGTGEGQFWMPSGICIDRDNHIFVSDTYNKRIQVFQLTQN